MHGKGEKDGHEYEEQSRERIIGTGIAMSWEKLKLVKHSFVVANASKKF